MKKKLLIALAIGLLVGAGAALLSSQRGPDQLAAGASPFQLVTQHFGTDEYKLSELRYFRLAAAKVNSEYVDPTRVEPDEMLRKSLDRVARIVPEFLWQRAEGSSALRLTMGSDSKDLVAPRVDSVAELNGVLTEVAVFVDSHLDDDFERPTVEYALMNGMLETLDPHSVYIEPDAYKEMSITNRGHFGGLGITIGIRDNRLTILYPLKDTPAWRAKLKAGDRIDRIGPESTVNMSLQEAVSKLRGKEGTQVTITVSDDDGPDREVTVTRARISVPSVESAYAGDGVGFIQVTHFAQETFDRISTSIDELTDQAIADKQGGLRGLVLDLRQNPGGYLQQAIEVADKFLKSGVIVSTELLANREKEANYARKFGTEDELPIVVLVDEGSASASEIVAGALKRQDRAVIMGVRTFGKGSVQNLYDRDFHDGALKLTIAQYLTPGDHSIQGVGIIPDIELRPAQVSTKDGEDTVRLYWQDFQLREEDLDNPFEWGTDDDESGRFVAVYACPECWEEADRDVADGPEQHLSDFEVQAAKSLILANPTNKRSAMLEGVEETLGEVFAQREQQLIDQLAGIDVDWARAPANQRKEAAVGNASVELEIGSDSGLLTPGVRTPVTVRVTNRGEAPLWRLRAVTEGEMMRGDEYFFGRLDPGEQREFTVIVEPPTWLHARTEEVTWHFFCEGAEPPPPFVGRLQVEEVPHPRFAYSWQVVDDGSGESRGNGDGLVQAGESIDLLVHVKNIGAGATSGLWIAERDGTELEPQGFVRLKNRSGESLFLVNGTAEFSLHAGEASEHRLHFRVADTLQGDDVLEADLVVGDPKFWVLLNSELKLPVHAGADAPTATERKMKPKSGPVAVRGGASAETPVVAMVRAPVEVTGKLGSWLRVGLENGVSGWVLAPELTSAGRSDKAVAPVPHLPNSPPILALSSSPGSSVLVSDELVLDGTVVDDTAVQDVYVFVNGRKVGYQALGLSESSAPFSFVVPLDPGENTIEIQARDDQDLRGNLKVGVYREAATAAVLPAAPAPSAQ